MVVVDIIRTILTSGLPCCILAIGIFITFRLLDFADMTAEGSFLLGAAATGLVLVKTNNPLLATLAGAAAGAICGLITGVLNRLVKIPKLPSGIITAEYMDEIKKEKSFSKKKYPKNNFNSFSLSLINLSYSFF